FKHINDGLGHQYGDVLLKAISHSLQRVEGIQNTCYRMGGDEFVIIVPPESYETFEKIVSQIQDIFAKPWYLKDADYYCTMSMGVVEFPDLGENVQELIKKADIAMYDAKKSGKNRVAKYSDKIVSSSNERLDMEKNMRDAMTEGYKEFEVYYQPIVDVTKDNRCVGAEALIRWNSDELGFIAPGDFIPLAEYLGLINPIGNYVLRQACEECHRWNLSGHPDYKVNVNLSVVQLLQSDIVEIVEDTLKDTGLEPKNLTLEVTESLAINDMERMKAILSKIKELGVKIALDDFGTGYSSLNHIREIPFDVIKVDQSFVKDLAEDDYSRSFVKMVAELAQTIGVHVCVEGIETEKQYGALTDMKIKYIQGYFFDMALSKDAFEEKYVAKKRRSAKTVQK
ncbi:MAG: bifunctional diguanylate cyclase/phosphodiesterase, partial [Lachnospiraceae bacterium]|nr:bifunctional diguanylate cyclase/phosphodiesterase [Lachnospiraceae bacterium]